VLSLPSTVKVFLATGTTDMRKGFDGLAAAAQETIGQDVLSGYMFVFANRRRTRLKILFWDGSGLWVCAKRLERGTFAWPAPPPEGLESVELSARELALLLEGIDLRETRRRNWWRGPAVAAPAVAATAAAPVA
jgi:transposase